MLFLMEKISFQSIEGKGDDDRSNGDSFDKNGCVVGRLDDEESDWTRSKIFLFTWRVENVLIGIKGRHRRVI